MSVQVTITRSQFLQLRKMSLINEDVFANCLCEEKTGDYKDINGNPVMRLTIIKPSDSGKAISAEDYLKGVEGSVTEQAEAETATAPAPEAPKA